MNNRELPPLMTATEVAQAFRVDPRTVTRWREAGKLSGIRLPGGRWRYLRGEVLSMLALPEDVPQVRGLMTEDVPSVLRPGRIRG